MPFGESIRSTKRSLYKRNDPFLMFWYKFIYPNQSLLERDLIDDVYDNCQKQFNEHVAFVWEDIARKSLIDINIDNIKWKPDLRWWGKGIDGKQMEIDIVADFFDHKNLLIGEVKREKHSDINRIHQKLLYMSKNFPNKKKKNIVLACWLKSKPKHISGFEHIFLPEHVM